MKPGNLITPAGEKRLRDELERLWNVERPKVTRVRIVPGEMAVTGCKMRDSVTGPTTGCFRSSCRTPGS